MRTLRGLSQEKLGNAVSLTFQQIQKYERGANRISASMLFQLAKVFGVPVSYFFEGLEESPEDTEPTLTRQSLLLVRDFNAIEDNDLKSAVSKLVKAMAKKNG